MKNEVLDILILGLLVVLFASIYRKRATARLRCWVIGWILVLVHFVALLLPAAAARDKSWSTASASAHCCSPACASFFPPLPFSKPQWVSALAAFGIGIPALFYTNY